jgi:hypothetical protein
MILCVSRRKGWFRKKKEGKGDISIHRGIQKGNYTEHKHTCTLLAERGEERENGSRSTHSVLERGNSSKQTYFYSMNL